MCIRRFSGEHRNYCFCSLALIEWLKSDESIENRAQYEAADLRIPSFLRSLLDGKWTIFSRFQHKMVLEWKPPYFDGEALLALTKQKIYERLRTYSRHLWVYWKPMYTQNVTLALQKDKRQQHHKRILSMGSMAFYEIFTAKWEGSEPYAKRTIEMAY